jgi:hypothetical protein
MAERPDYLPRTWTRVPLDRHFWASPTHVFAWLVVAPFGFVVVAALNLIVGSTVVGAIVLLCAVVSIVQAAIYAPRALRAVRAQERR